jgi:hypothetical protein
VASLPVRAECSFLSWWEMDYFSFEHVWFNQCVCRKTLRLFLITGEWIMHPFFFVIALYGTSARKIAAFIIARCCCLSDQLISNCLIVLLSASGNGRKNPRL